MRLYELEIKNFRGIKELTLSPDGENIVIWGDNGSGKSAVVDSVDFLLTGNIHRLLGTGTAGITLKKHGAHIDCDDHSESYVRALVKVDNEVVEIRRCVDDPNNVKCSHDKEKFFDSIEEVSLRGQHILTRREILKFVTSKGSTRAKEIESILNLEAVGEIRSTFVKLKNQAKNVQQLSQSNFVEAKSNIASRLGLANFDVTEVLEEINKNRSVLGSKAIDDLTEKEIKNNVNPPGTHPDEDLVNIQVFKDNVSQITRVSLQDFQNEIKENEQKIRDIVSDIHKNNGLLHAYSTRELVSLGISALDNSGLCPLCDTQWESQQLENHLREKLESADIVKEKNKEIEETAGHISTQLSLIKSHLSRVITTITPFDLEDELAILNSWQESLTILSNIIDDPINNYKDHPYTINQVQRLLAPTDIEEISLSILDEAEKKFPKTTPEQSAWDILTELSVEVKALETATVSFNDAQSFYSRASSLHDSFILSRDEILANIYGEIKNRFVDFYRNVHSEDETHFDAILEPSDAALDFKVDFYGRGPHPPHALHSEGHQDSMGVCLFLALYEELTPGLLDLIILDDVVMSVDWSHRRALCRLLSECFQDKQLLITTHDKIWAMQLKQNGIVKPTKMYEFFDWNLELGPRVSDVVDIWSRIQRDLDNNDIPAAAARLRRGSEQFFSEVCDNILAPVRFHIDGNYTLGDLLFPAMSQFKKLTRDAIKAEASWQGKEPAEIILLDDQRKEIFGNVAEEQWAINVNVHFNEWSNFTKNDFVPVVKAFRDLFNFFTCERCGDTLCVVQDGLELKNLRCNCTKYNWNLVKKK